MTAYTHGTAPAEFLERTTPASLHRFCTKSGVLLVSFQHFMGNIEDHDPALNDAFAADYEAILFNNAGAPPPVPRTRSGRPRVTPRHSSTLLASTRPTCWPARWGSGRPAGGFDHPPTSTYEEGCADFVAALESRGWAVDHIPSHLVDTQMPSTVEALSRYAVIALSDVGSNTFLLGRQTFFGGQVAPDLLELIAAYTSDGGGLVMVGGYMSFSGIEGKARYGQTCLQEVLPVSVSAADDRVERPAGVAPTIDLPGHPTVAAIAGPWPRLLGYNRLTARPPGQVVARCGNDLLLAVGTFGRGRSVAFASDLGPHWAPAEFTSWEGYPALWHGIASWAAGLDH